MGQKLPSDAPKGPRPPPPPTPPQRDGKDRPILFNGPMVRALLAGTKTQTRRIVKLPLRDPDFGCELAGNEIGPKEAARLCPYGQPGDRLWVRETWASIFSQPVSSMVPGDVAYRSDGVDPSWRRVWRPSIFMPRWASRITLEITGVRVERLQEISEGDATAEGMVKIGRENCTYPFANRREWFASYWDSINAERAPWASNPWVWIVEFRRIDADPA